MERILYALAYAFLSAVVGVVTLYVASATFAGDNYGYGPYLLVTAVFFGVGLLTRLHWIIQVLVAAVLAVFVFLSAREMQSSVSLISTLMYLTHFVALFIIAVLPVWRLKWGR